MTRQGRGIAGRIASAFIDSRLTPLIVLASVLLGVGAVVLLPREEEPQIIVPMIDVFVRMPGASAGEVEERVTKPMEKLLWEIPGVEYIYSTSAPGKSMAVVRFRVGEDETVSLGGREVETDAKALVLRPSGTWLAADARFLTVDGEIVFESDAPASVRTGKLR